MITPPNFDAIKAFKAAYSALTETIRNEMRKQLNETLASEGEVTALAELANLAYSNRSSWSGGPHSETNVIEAITRETAVSLLNELASSSRMRALFPRAA